MKNAELGRQVLDHVDAHPEQFDMWQWGYESTVCGTVACLAGRTLLLSGYSLDDDGHFWSPDGTPVSPSYEAAQLLGLTDSERWGGDGEPSLFMDMDSRSAIARFRVMVESAEAAKR